MSYASAAWILSWIAAALWSAPASARPGWHRERFYRLVTITGVFLLCGVYDRAPWYGRALWTAADPLGWLLAAITIAGFLFTWWARIHLGRLWSASITRKAEHHVVDTGPYALVRHPIYTGIIFATAAMAIERSSIAALAGLAILTSGWYIKARLEERFLREQLGREQYDAYAARVPMLVPFTEFNTSRGKA